MPGAADSGAARMFSMVAWKTGVVKAGAAGSGRPAHSHAPAATITQAKPNILVIFGDDIGYWNVSAYNRGMMGYRTPNIDRIAKEGAIFTDSLRAAELHGRAGRVHHRPVAASAPACSKVGLPGAKEGLSAKDPTIADCSSRRATRPGSSARTISATATSSSRPCTASTSSSATSIT